MSGGARGTRCMGSRFVLVLALVACDSPGPPPVPVADVVAICMRLVRLFEPPGHHCDEEAGICRIEY